MDGSNNLRLSLIGVRRTQKVMVVVFSRISGFSLSEQKVSEAPISRTTTQNTFRM